MGARGARESALASGPGGGGIGAFQRSAKRKKSKGSSRPGLAAPPHGGCSDVGTRERGGGEGQGTWASQKHREAGYGRPVDRGEWTAKTVKRPPQQSAHPQYANYWAPLTRKRHIPPHPTQPQHTNHWAPRTRKRHRQEHRLQRPTERNDPTQHAKGRTGDCPGPRKGATTRRNVTRGGRVRAADQLGARDSIALQRVPFGRRWWPHWTRPHCTGSGMFLRC